MSILALDLGTTTGWALKENDHIVHGFESFKDTRFSGGGMRYLRFHKWLVGVNCATPLTEVYFEEVRAHEGTDAAHVYGGFLATLTKFCEQMEIPYEGKSVGTIKKFWCKKGNAGKQMMIEEANRRGFKVTDDNEADALAILHLAIGL